MGQAFDDVHAVYCYFESGIILSGVCIQINNSVSKIINIFVDCTSKNS